MESNLGLFPIVGTFRPKAFTMDLFNNTLLTFGGYSSQAQKLSILRDIHTITDDFASTWEIISIPASTARAAHVSFILDGHLHVHGGYGSKKESTTQLKAYSTMEKINLETYECKRLHYSKVVQNVERRWHCSFVIDNKFFIHGGWNDGGPVSDLTSLHLDTMAWQTISCENAPPARRWHTLTQLSNSKKCILFGGYHGDYKDTFADTHILDIEGGSWYKPEMKGECPPPRINHTLEEIGNKQLFLLGGRDERQDTCQESFVLTLDNMTWHKVKNGSELYCINRSGHKAVRVGEYGMVVGGGNNAKYIDPFYYMDTRMLQI